MRTSIKTSVAGLLLATAFAACAGGGQAVPQPRATATPTPIPMTPAIGNACSLPGGITISGPAVVACGPTSTATP